MHRRSGNARTVASRLPHPSVSEGIYTSLTTLGRIIMLRKAANPKQQRDYRVASCRKAEEVEKLRWQIAKYHRDRSARRYKGLRYSFVSTMSLSSLLKPTGFRVASKRLAVVCRNICGVRRNFWVTDRIVALHSPPCDSRKLDSWRPLPPLRSLMDRCRRARPSL